jgi:hypothetical protein
MVEIYTFNELQIKIYRQSLIPKQTHDSVTRNKNVIRVDRL